MMIMAFIGGQHSAQVKLVKQLTKDLQGCYHVKHINNNYREWSDDEKYTRLRQVLKRRKNNGLVIVVTGISTTYELALLRRNNATICIPHAPLHRLFNENPILVGDLFVCIRPGSLDTPQKQKKYITPEEAFSVCYSRTRGFRDVA